MLLLLSESQSLRSAWPLGNHGLDCHRDVSYGSHGVRWINVQFSSVKERWVSQRVASGTDLAMKNKIAAAIAGNADVSMPVLGAGSGTGQDKTEVGGAPAPKRRILRRGWFIWRERNRQVLSLCAQGFGFRRGDKLNDSARMADEGPLWYLRWYRRYSRDSGAPNGSLHGGMSESRLGRLVTSCLECELGR
jgi:hypothetical protein